MVKTKQFYQIFANSFELPVEVINNQLEYQGIAEWDSMSHLILISELEKTYKITIKREDVLEMTSVKNVIDKLKSYGVVITNQP